MKSAKPPKSLIITILSKLAKPNHPAKTLSWKNSIFFLIPGIIGLALMFEGLEVESLVCQRGEKATNTCEIFQNILWQQKSIKKFPLSSLKEARVKESRYKGKTMTSCRLLTTEGELSFGIIGGGNTLEKQKIVFKINAFLQNPNQLKLSVQESLDFFIFFLGIFMSGFALCLFCSCFYSVFCFIKKIEP